MIDIAYGSVGGIAEYGLEQLLAREANEETHA